MVVECVSIPADVPVGAVIGKKGSRQKALVAVHRVRTQVDVESREVILRGDAKNVKSAEHDLLALFETLKIDAKRVRRWAIQDGAAKTWRFVLNPTMFGDFDGFPYIWRGTPTDESPTDRGHEAAKPEEMWVSEFNDNWVTRTIKEIDEMESGRSSETKMKIAFGFQSFLLTGQARVADVPLSWDDLRALSPTRDVIPKWRGLLARQSATTNAIATHLIDLAEKNKAEWSSLVSVYVKEVSTGRCFFVKYSLEGGVLKPGRRGVRRVCGSYDVLLANQAEFRLRVVSREALSDTTWRAIADCVRVKLPSDGDVFRAKVVLDWGKQKRFELQDFTVKRKAHVEWSGLRFTLSRMSDDRTDTRIECRAIPADGAPWSLSRTAEASLRRVQELLSASPEELAKLM
ncbi:hypothetical protein ATCC90586_001687 [Pythium insidiosum]|nr:hypothetical protein ATCC90586_001687 [Pythium insidiosum]